MTSQGTLTPVPKAVSLNMNMSMGVMPLEAATAAGNSMLSNASIMEAANGFGRIKPKPICKDQTLKKEAMSAAQISEFCFKTTPIQAMPVASSFSSGMPSSSTVVTRSSEVAPGVSNGNAPVSSGSSTASNASTISSWELDHSVIPGSIHGGNLASTPVRLEVGQSERINQKVTARKESRNGRKTQRWQNDDSRVYRLVTGCVPIVEGGKIMFVSASRKPEWILPKGGWEQDESMEESAIRESFEEAGVLGILGPKLSPISYETRKAKKRRLESEKDNFKITKLATTHEVDERIMPAPRKLMKTESFLSTTESECAAPTDEATDSPKRANMSQGVDNSVSIVPSSPIAQIVSGDAMSKIKSDGAAALAATSPMAPRSSMKKTLFDDASSVVSEASHYSHVRMTLFPLYVSKVKGEWPESGRFRTVLSIDEAIERCKNRPELQQALMEVKERKLHLAGHFEASQERSQASGTIVATPTRI